MAELFLRVPLMQFVVLVFEARTIAQEKGCLYEPREVILLVEVNQNQ